MYIFASTTLRYKAEKLIRGLAMANIEIHKTKQGGNAVYFFGMIGAWVYYFKQTETFVEVMGALFKGLVWPAFVVYDVLLYVHI